MIFGLYLDLLRNLFIRHCCACARERHQRAIGHVRTAQQIRQRRLARQRLAQHARGVLLRQLLRAQPSRAQALLFFFNRRALGFQHAPARIIHHAEFAALGRETQIRIVFAQHQTILRAAGEHAIRLGRAARNQIINQHADIGLVAARVPRRFILHAQRGVDARDNALRRSLFVAGGAVDLAREE